ncbi:aminopeptidase [Sphingomonas sp. Root710]|uniref:M1 family metallopeptidase n=1 Tax=Sphingomonas sp. Root710 TaxID=1736594 RepID=UPI0007000368|nr:M1 family metallopeptidase [Sphingomonas sp. Root710]KRB86698.1 aminopeptidase [Sphingomonas sp. Root710]
MRIILPALLLLAAPLSAAAPVPSPILTTPDARDALSYARPEVARVTHVDLDLRADFAAKVMRGSATLDIAAKPGASEIILDDKGLVIERITDAGGRALTWAVGKADDYKGAPLTIRIGAARRIVIAYHSKPDASALGWLPPELTAGKKKPFLFSQGQSIENRSWIPTQDSPGIRQSWSARITVPADLVAVMSGTRLTPRGEPAGKSWKRYRFRMEHPVPPYLIALAVGDLAFKPLGARTGVYAEPVTLAPAARELDDTEKMVRAAEGLYGPYRWGRYDMLVLPPSFPYGGMENPTLTFLTPTIFTGDKANTDVVAHELAHSWSGNLVTNATWSDSWLNEGFTTYFENRIDEIVYGKERAAVLADLSWDDLQRDLKEAKPPATRLHGEPEELYGELAYNKGAIFLRTIEHAVGRSRWDAYLRSYFDRHAFQPQTTANFLKDIRARLVKGDAALEKQLQLDAWAYQPGLPGNAYRVRSATLAQVDRAIEQVSEGAPVGTLPFSTWGTQEWQRFLNGLPRKLSTERLAELDGAMRLSASPNAYVRSAWLVLALGNRYQPAVVSAEEYLPRIGRMLLIRPVYRTLVEQGAWGRPIAERIYAGARPHYHPVTVASVDKIVGFTP